MADREALFKDITAGETDPQTVAVYDQTTTPTNEATKAKLYAKDVGGVAKMHALDSTGAEIELGSGGGGGGSSLSDTLVKTAAPQHGNTQYAPVALYVLNSSLADTSGNGNNLSVGGGSEEYYGANHVPGDSSFHSVGNWLQSTVPAARVTGEVTVMAWINPAVFSSCSIVSCDGGGETEAGNVLWNLGLNTTGRVRIFHEYGAGSSNELISSSNYLLREGTNQHVVMSRAADGITYKIYVNGVFVETIVATNAPTGGTSNSVLVGANFTGADAYTGSVWDVAIYDTQLTDAQILAEYQRQTGASGDTVLKAIGPQHSDTRLGPVVQYSLNGTLADGSGNGHDLTVSAGSEDYYGDNHVPGDQSGLFTGNDFWTAGEVLDLETAGVVSVMAWVKAYAVSSTMQIAGYNGPSDASADNALWVFGVVSDGTLRCFQENGAGVNVTVSTPFRVIREGEMVHVAMTRASDGVTVNFYKNGVHVHTGVASGAPDGGASGTLNVGAFASATDNFNGSIWDVMAFNQELTAAQIKAEYQRQVGQSPVVRTGRALHGLDHSPLGLWQLQTDGSDSSGNGKDVTATTPLFRPGWVGTAADFGANTNAYSITDNSFELTGAMSVYMLLKPDSVSAEDLLAYASDGETEPTNALYWLSLTSGFLEYAHEYGGGNNDGFVDTNLPITAGEWVWVGFTRDSAGTGIKLFVNGELAASTTLANAPTGGTSASLHIGTLYPTGIDPLNGMLQSVKIVGSELTEAEMRAEYERCFGVGDGASSVANPQHIIGATNESLSVSGSEVTIGALIFDGGSIPIGQNASFFFLGVAEDPAVTSVGSAYLYDLGPAAGPEAAPVLRATLSIDTSTADDGKVLRKAVQLVPSASPGAAPQVFNTARLYQLRADRTVSGGSETFSVFQAGIVIE